ncbi:MAG: carbohydrate-binding family 9-like protein, partial [Bryobacteraceae bacterium]
MSLNRKPRAGVAARLTASVLTGVLSTASGQSPEAGEMHSEYIAKPFPLTADPEAAAWKGAAGIVTSHDRYGKEIPGARTEIRSRWTRRDLCFLFISQYQTQHLKGQPSKTKETWALWEYDVVEVFIGWNALKPSQYKEFEVSPQEEWVDLDCDRDRKGTEVDWRWDSGFRARSRVDERQKIWYCEMAIPWKSIDERRPTEGNQLRLNLYRIEGAPPNRKYLTWRPVNAESFHTPEAFGQIRLMK